MELLQVIEDAPGFVKATFQGPQGSGKTFTAALLACTAQKMFCPGKPVAFYDTETGSDFVAKLLENGTGRKPLRVKTRAFSDLMKTVHECIDGAAGVLIVDSITHVWRELNAAYMAKVNERSRYPKVRLDIADIMQIKELWYPWPDLYLNSPLHIIVCGREGNEWGREENEETGKSDLITVGKKMKVESEFGYEASLMVSMAARQINEARVKKAKNAPVWHRPRSIVNVATILKDRYNKMNGEVIEYPTGESFLPHLEDLNPALHVGVNMDVKSNKTMPDTGDDGWGYEKRNRVIACEEIQGLLVKFYPGQTAKDKAAKSALIERAFKTRSWTRVETLDSGTLRAGLIKLTAVLDDPAAFEAELADSIPNNLNAA